MKAILAHLRYFVTDAVDEWRHSPGVNLLATVTLCAVLFVAGLVLLVLSNVGGYLDEWREELRVQVYLLDDATPEARDRIRQTLSGLDEVSRVVYVDKAEALHRFRQSFGEAMAGLSAELETNPLPASFEAFLVSSEAAGRSARAVADALAGLEGVEEVRFDQDLLDRLDALLRLARVGGALLAVLVFGAVVLVMASVLRLAVYARRDEIEIMQLVGAAPAFVRGPFLVAGLAQGLAASVAALVIVEGVRRLVLHYTGSSPAALVSLVAGRPLSLSIALLIAVVGLAVSFAGSYFAVRRTT